MKWFTITSNGKSLHCLAKVRPCGSLLVTQARPVEQFSQASLNTLHEVNVHIEVLATGEQSSADVA